MSTHQTGRLINFTRPLSRAPLSRAVTPAQRLSVADATLHASVSLGGASGSGRMSSMGFHGMSSSNKKSMFKRFSSNKTPPPAEHLHSGSTSNKNQALDEKLLTEGYTEDELKEYHQVFSLFDTDDSGSIGIDELANAMHSMGMSPDQKELENLIKEVDEDGNGEIDFEEFCKVMKRMGSKNKLSWDDITKQCFEVFDRNQTGTITDLEFRYILQNLGEINDEKVIEGIFSEFDVDGNGLIDYEEFSNMVRSYMTEEDLESCNNNNKSQISLNGAVCQLQP